MNNDNDKIRKNRKLNELNNKTIIKTDELVSDLIKLANKI